MNKVKIIRGFFNMIRQERDAVQKRVKYLETRIERLRRSMPVNGRCGSNMYLSQDGRIWQYNIYSLIEVRRTWNPFWYIVAFFCGWKFRYAPFVEVNQPPLSHDRALVYGGSIQSIGDLVFVQRSGIETEFEDWCWEIPFPWGRHGGNPTISYWESCLAYTQRRLAFNNVVLERHKEISLWMAQDVEQRDRSKSETWQDDWDELYTRFIPSSMSRMDCPQGRNLVELHRVLDALAGKSGIRFYCY